MRKSYLFILVISCILILFFISYITFGKKATLPSSNQNTNSSYTHAGSCQILQEQYCKNGKLIEKEINGHKYKLVGFNLSIGTTIYSSKKGKLLTGKFDTGPLLGFYGSVTDSDNKESIKFIGDIKFTNPNNLNIEKGESIGIIQNSGVLPVDKYNLVFFPTIGTEIGKPAISNEALIKTLLNL